MDIKLKPCPFCGGEAEFEHVQTKHIFLRKISYPYVECSVCGASTSLKYTEREAIKA